ncbi:pilus assembly protein CpaF [Aliiroseovarius crassostreae]|uniref:Type II secretion system protein E n=1 Tax=Aliiroseovarius crassostreae TaxID=154981 RepID=A0A0P7ITI3_9RHOB|nr:CpaF family protein [Aliiroseovarius crassostreae]KPN62127.1 type II secretion system protein E [Aliiroseovarius crassostreae]SFU91027.1 pilus assembly protein CpaF [Aliiroseovarius crassostreae]
MAGRFFRKAEQKSDGVAAPVETDLVLREREMTGAKGGPSAAQAKAAQLPDFVSERVDLHRFLLDKINLAVLDTLEKEELHDELRPLVRDYARINDFPLSTKELENFISDIADEMLGLGPLEPLIGDDTISDILVVGPNRVYVERFGRLEQTQVRFKDENHLMRIVQKIVASVGRRVDESSPLVDARLQDGSRVNVAIRPVAVDGPQVSIRKFSRSPFSLDRLVANGALPGQMAKLLAAAVEGKVSLIISGGTGSGKTTLLNALSAFIPHEERLVTIEDAAELQLQQPHVVRLETRPPSVDGRNEILQRDLVKNALRMRPDRIVIGEVRGSEAFDMLQAMNTGHEGSMTTIHANNPRDALSRVEQMVGMAGMPMSQNAIRSQISSAIHLIVQVDRQRDGSRRLMSISELTGMEGDVIQLQEIMKFVRTGISEDGVIEGEFRATGIRPRFLDELETLGLVLDKSMFDPAKKVE